MSVIIEEFRCKGWRERILEALQSRGDKWLHRGEIREIIIGRAVVRYDIDPIGRNLTDLKSSGRVDSRRCARDWRYQIEYRLRQ